MTMDHPSRRASFEAPSLNQHSGLETIDEEVQSNDDVGIIKSIMKTTQTKSPVHLIYLAALSAMLVLSYDFVLKGSDYNYSGLDTLDAQLRFVKENALRSRYAIEPPPRDMMEGRMRRKLLDERILKAVDALKQAWPECVNTSKFTTHQKEVVMHNSKLRMKTDHQYGPKLSGLECKAFIDEEILNGKDDEGTEFFQGTDKQTRVILRPKRRPTDAWYNTVVIPMNDDDIVEGRDHDGLVHYDFTWDGSGEAATPEQETDIPPIIATETEAGSPTYTPPPALASPATSPPTPPPTPWPTPSPVAPTSPGSTPAPIAAPAPTLPPVPVPTSPPVQLQQDPLEILDSASIVEGGTVEGSLVGTDTMTPEEYQATYPAAGGVAIDPLATDATTPTAENPDAHTEFESTINDLMNTDVPPAGERELESVNCEGLNGINCCLLVKATFHDADASGRSIQCTLDYVEESNKKLFMNNRGQKVIIKENHNEVVINEPKLIGSWPKGWMDELEGWVVSRS